MADNSTNDNTNLQPDPQETLDANGGTPDVTPSALVGNSTAPDLSSPAVMPNPQSPGSPEEQDMDNETPVDRTNPMTGNGGMWTQILQGALAGLAGQQQHGRSSFANGMIGGAKGAEVLLAQQRQQQQQDLENSQKSQQLDDEHQTANARLAYMHTQLHILDTQYDLMPKNMQDVIDQESMKQGALLEHEGNQPINSKPLSYVDAKNLLATQMQSDQNAPFSNIMTENTDGTFNVYHIGDPTKMNTQPIDVTTGYHMDKDGNPQFETTTMPAGTVRISDALASHTAVAARASAEQNATYQKQQQAEFQEKLNVKQQRDELPIKLQEEKAKQAVTDGDPSALAQLLVDGDVAPSQVISSRKPEVAQQAFSAAKKLNPNWNAQQAEGYFKVASNPGQAQFFGSANSLLDHGGTLDQLQGAYNQLPNGQIPAINAAVDWTTGQVGGKTPSGFQATAIGLADDYAKVMGGGQGTDSARNEILKTIMASSSPAQMKQTLTNMRAAVTSQVGARIGTNPIARKMYGQNLPAQSPQSTQTPSNPDAVQALINKHAGGQ